MQITNNASRFNLRTLAIIGVICLLGSTIATALLLMPATPQGSTQDQVNLTNGSAAGQASNAPLTPVGGETVTAASFNNIQSANQLSMTVKQIEAYNGVINEWVQAVESGAPLDAETQMYFDQEVSRLYSTMSLGNESSTTTFNLLTKYYSEDAVITAFKTLDTSVQTNLLDPASLIKPVIPQ